MLVVQTEKQMRRKWVPRRTKQVPDPLEAKRDNVRNNLAMFANIIEDERWHGDGPPGWPNAVTEEEAIYRAVKAIKRLRRFSHVPGATLLADRLACCREDHRCMSGACYLCARAFQRWCVKQIVEASHDPEA
jgi:hypothetical protein